MIPAGASDPLPTLDRLAEVAIAVFDEHLNSAECCAICGTGCGTGWPCEQVVLADHNLAVL
ncbi:hypothetical protein FXN61_00460 [Lentzea sp. PSKA42]|uniref:Uncharacterized protein n=1 Tax=Lentzea indica TaxID=2604800 RepID=A0ABX1F903_9PSEU|nr:hypothetical protein [Lentzea indica]